MLRDIEVYIKFAEIYKMKNERWMDAKVLLSIFNLWLKLYESISINRFFPYCWIAIINRYIKFWR